MPVKTHESGEVVSRALPPRRPMLRRPAAADYLSVSANYLAKLAVYGTGPAFIKLGRTVLYDPDDIDRWVAARRVNSTSEYRHAAARQRVGH